MRGVLLSIIGARVLLNISRILQCEQSITFSDYNSNLREAPLRCVPGKLVWLVRDRIGRRRTILSIIDAKVLQIFSESSSANS